MKQPIEDRIKALRADIEAYIDARIADEKTRISGVPEGVLRKCLIGYAGDCECRQYLKISADVMKATA